MSVITVRSASIADAAGMAAVHVQSWQETYRGLVPDDVLDSDDAINRRLALWNRVLSEQPKATSTAVAVDEATGQIVGIAQSGSPRDDDADQPIELYLLYVLAAYHGTGAGHGLLDAVLGAHAAFLWTAATSARAQAFYRKCGFVPDGTIAHKHMPELRMVRG